MRFESRHAVEMSTENDIFDTENEIDAGFPVRGLSPDVRERLRLAVRAGGGNKAVAEAASVPISTLNGTLAGKSEPRASVLAAIAKATGRSLDWLMYGIEPQAAVAPTSAQQASPDIETLVKVVQLVEDWLSAHGRVMPPAKKAETIGAIYQFVMEDIEAGAKSIDTRKLTQFLRLVA